MRVTRDLLTARRGCGAAMMLIEQVTAEQLLATGWPDELDRTRPAPDMSAVDGAGRLWYFEHTLVETFEFQCADHVKYRDLLSGLREDLDGRLPTDSGFEVWVRADFRLRYDLAGARRDIADAVAGVAPDLAIGSRSTAPGHIGCTTCSGGAIEIRVVRWPRRHPPWVFAWAPEDLIPRQQERATRSAEREAPKLACRQVEGAVTVLVLEKQDILQDWSGPAHASIVALREHGGPVPDYTVLADTTGETEIIAFLIARGLRPEWPEVDSYAHVPIEAIDARLPD